MTYYDDQWHLDNSDHKILDLVYKFRFINRKQIQRIFDHNTPRRVNPWLKDLVGHSYLGRIYNRNKLLENTKPAVYFLTNRGIGWVRWNYFENHPKKAKRFYQDKTASERFKKHCLAVCDLYVNSIPPKENPDDEYFFTTLTELWNHAEDNLHYLKTIKPDAQIEHSFGDNLTTYFLDLIEPYVPMYALRYKVDQYIEFRSNSEDWWDIYAYGKNFDIFEVRLILPNQSKLNRIRKYIQERLNESYDIENMKFMLTTHKKAQEKGINNNDIWIEVVEDF